MAGTNPGARQTYEVGTATLEFYQRDGHLEWSSLSDGKPTPQADIDAIREHAAQVIADRCGRDIIDCGQRYTSNGLGYTSRMIGKSGYVGGGGDLTHREAEAIVRRQMASHISPFIFLNDDGKPYAAGVFRRKLERWCARAKVTQRTPYALRHTFASVEAENGVDALTLAQLMGHANVTTTARYVSTTQEHHRTLSQKAAAHFGRLLEAGHGGTVEAPQAGLGSPADGMLDRRSA